jgi:hypothetical protein
MYAGYHFGDLMRLAMLRALSEMGKRIANEA